MSSLIGWIEWLLNLAMALAAGLISLLVLRWFGWFLFWLLFLLLMVIIKGAERTFERHE